jgi:uncharacterized protein (TIGR02647 family)
MPYTPEVVEEIKILSLFNLSTTQEGIKVHKSADSNAITAAERLYEKGMLTQSDGGYLTVRGQEAAEHAQNLLAILTE